MRCVLLVTPVPFSIDPENNFLAKSQIGRINTKIDVLLMILQLVCFISPRFLTLYILLTRILSL
jgi:hypothetical protein